MLGLSSPLAIKRYFGTLLPQQENIDAITQSIFLIVTHQEKDVDSFLCIVKIILSFKVNNY